MTKVPVDPGEPSAYAKMMKDKRKQTRRAKKNREQPAATAKAWGATCGAKVKNGTGRCSMAAGWGTNHPGTGSCKWHGGSVPAQVKRAAVDEYGKLLGTPKEINPFDAIMWCIKLRAGEIEWLSQEMEKLQSDAWVEETLVGKQFHLYARERQAAMRDLAKYSHMAISLGLAERQVRLAEMYGETIAKLIGAILNDPELGLTEQQRKKSPQIVRRHLILIEGAASEKPAAITSGKSTPKKKRAA